LHYTLLDAQGDSLLVEFIAGQTVLYKNPNVAILTNNSYSHCLSLVEKNASDKIAASNSIARFAHLLEQSSRATNQTSPGLGFEFLNSVNQSPGSTQSFPWNSHDTETVTAWSIVFNPTEKSIALKTDRNHAIRQLNLRDFGFEPTENYLVADVNAGTAGPMEKYFEPYSKEKNQELLRHAAPIVGLPGEVQDELATVVDALYSNRQM
jgi:choloylglycine hydrolase